MDIKQTLPGPATRRGFEKVERLFVTLALGLATILAWLWLMNGAVAAPIAEPVHRPAQASNDVITVCLSGSCDYNTVQAAVDAASEGDVIKVSSGTYTDVHRRPRRDVATTGPVSQVVYLSKTVTIQGGYTTTNWVAPAPDVNLTMLDARGRGRVFYVTGDVSPSIEGVHIVGGNAIGLGGSEYSNEGGGVYVITAAVTLSGCHVTGNEADTGGGMSLRHYDHATLINNQVYENSANNGSGGGVSSFLGHLTCTTNHFTHNHAAGYGGGVYLQNSPAIFAGNLFSGNEGAGLYFFASDPATLTANNIFSNTGPGLQLVAAKVLLDNNVIAGNDIGLRADGGVVTLRHNTLARNGALGVYLSPAPWASSGGVAAITNTILAGHIVGISVTGGCTATTNGVLWHDTTITLSQATTAVVSIQNQYIGDPSFVDPDAGDYHLGSGSAAIDRGVNTAVIADMDGDRRPIGPLPDLGADEAWRWVYLPLVSVSAQDGYR